jgi:acyl-CoA dehydrogenase
MIDFSIPEDTRLLVDTVRRFVETEVQPLEDEVERTAIVPADALAITKAKAQKLGLYAMNMPADVGGGGLSCI